MESALFLLKPPSLVFISPTLPSLRSSIPRFLKFNKKLPLLRTTSRAIPMQGALSEAISLIQSSPPTWSSSLFSNIVIFVLASPILLSGLSLSGIISAFFLGTLTWRSFGPQGFLIVVSYFLIGTAATKVKMAQKEAQGIAEKRRGRRGWGSVIGSSAAACVCSLLAINDVGGPSFSHIWQLGFVSCFCTKLSDTVASEIGKAYGKTTYLATTFKIVPRGTEGAVSAEGTLAGVVAAVLLSAVGFLTSQITAVETAICILSSQIANFIESLIGASIQGKKGYQWLNNDVVNIINISIGCIISISLRLIL